MEEEFKKDVSIAIKYLQSLGGKYKVQNFHAVAPVKNTTRIILLMKRDGYVKELGPYYELTHRGLIFKDFESDELFEDEEKAQKEIEKQLIKSTLKTNRIQNRTSIFSIIIAAVALIFSIYQFFVSQENTHEIRDLRLQIIKLKKINP